MDRLRFIEPKMPLAWMIGNSHFKVILHQSEGSEMEKPKVAFLEV